MTNPKITLDIEQINKLIRYYSKEVRKMEGEGEDSSLAVAQTVAYQSVRALHGLPLLEVKYGEEGKDVGTPINIGGHAGAALRKAGVTTWEQVQSMPIEKLTSIKRIGRKTAEDLCLKAKIALGVRHKDDHRGQIIEIQEDYFVIKTVSEGFERYVALGMDKVGEHEKGLFHVEAPVIYDHEKETFAFDREYPTEDEFKKASKEARNILKSLNRKDYQ